MSNEYERAVTTKVAEEITGIPQWKIRQAIKNKQLKSYAFGNSRTLVYVSEINALIKSSCRTADQNGGGQ